MHSTIPQRPQRERLVPEKGIDLHVADMTATFSGDVTLRDAQEKLASVNQWLPVDGDENATLASLVESNSTGPLRLGFGAWRDNLLGVQFVNGRGELISAGGRVVKNVAGYDLTRFMVGQFGMFGEIQAITTRTYLRPTHAILAAFDPAPGKLNQMLVTSCRPHWCAVTDSALLMGYLGDDRAMAFYSNALKAYSPEEVLVHSLADDITARSKLWNIQGSQIRAMLPPSAVKSFAESNGIKDWVADAAFGVLKAPGIYDAVALRKSAESLGGQVIHFDVDGKPKDFSLSPDVRTLIRTLKSAFDPDGQLASLIP